MALVTLLARSPPAVAWLGQPPACAGLPGRNGRAVLTTRTCSSGCCRLLVLGHVPLGLRHRSATVVVGLILQLGHVPVGQGRLGGPVAASNTFGRLASELVGTSRRVGVGLALEMRRPLGLLGLRREPRHLCTLHCSAWPLSLADAARLARWLAISAAWLFRCWSLPTLAARNARCCLSELPGLVAEVLVAAGDRRRPSQFLGLVGEVLIAPDTRGAGSRDPDGLGVIAVAACGESKSSHEGDRCRPTQCPLAEVRHGLSSSVPGDRHPTTRRCAPSPTLPSHLTQASGGRWSPPRSRHARAGGSGKRSASRRPPGRNGRAVTANGAGSPDPYCVGTWWLRAGSTVAVGRSCCWVTYCSA